jgi:hypothetical protein
MSLHIVLKEIHDCIIELRDNYNLTHNITDYYKITYVYQDKSPITEKNQIFFDKLITFFPEKKLVIQDVKNVYTILTKKFEKNSIGIIIKTSLFYSINLNIETKFKEIVPNIKEYNDDCLDDTFFCSEEDYYKYCYIIKNPELDDNIYFSSYGQIHLIKENKLYLRINNIKNDSFYDIDDWSFNNISFYKYKNS